MSIPSKSSGKICHSLAQLFQSGRCSLLYIPNHVISNIRNLIANLSRHKTSKGGIHSINKIIAVLATLYIISQTWRERAVKHTLFRGGTSASGTSSLRSVAGNSKGNDGTGNGSGGDGKGNGGEGIWGSGDDSGVSRDGGGHDEGSAAATAAMSASVAAAIDSSISNASVFLADGTGLTADGTKYSGYSRPASGASSSSSDTHWNLHGSELEYTDV
ncbi:hypothetical protein Tco_0775222 [Tanacetum coccineum]